MTRRMYAGGAQPTTLAAPMTNSDTSLTVASGTNYPDGSTGKAVLTLDAGLAGEEKVLYTSRSGNTFTGLTRGYDGTSAVSHSSGASVRHTISAVDLDEANAHVNATGATDPHPGYVQDAEIASMVTLTGTQTLTNKTLTTPTIGSFTNAQHTHADAAGGGTLTDQAKTIRIPHTFTLIGDIDASKVVPGFFIDLPAGQTAKLRHARYRLNSGTSVTVPVTVNGTTKITASVVAAAGDTADANFALSDNDYITLGTPTSLVGTPNGLSLTVYIDVTV